jgi:hypothetical protein
MRIKKIFVIAFFIGFIFPLSARQTPNPVDIICYHFVIEISDSSNMIKGSATIDLVLKNPVSSFTLNLHKRKNELGMQISSLLVDGLPSCYHFGDDDKVYIKNNTADWPVNQVMQVRIDYFGIPAEGLIITNNKFGKRSFFADNWPDRAHYWIPVIDHPSDKAKVSFDIIAPEHYEVIASGKHMDTLKESVGNLRHTFSTNFEFPTKVMVFAASEFRIIPYDTVYGIPVSAWIYEDNISGDYDFLPAVEALKFYSDTIGPYIYSKLANVQSKTRYGGMENAGNIFYFEGAVNAKRSMEDLIAHEVAHHWFGNAVSESDWQHIWISEGFATYLANLFFEYKYGTKVLADRMKKERSQVLDFGRGHSAKVVDESVTDLMYLLNPNSYEKGAWVLHMLRRKVGDEAFYNILQAFYDHYKFSNANTTDFIRISEEISGRDLESFFEQWLYYTVNPTLDIDWFLLNDSFYVRVAQTQSGYTYNLDLEIETANDRYCFPIDYKENYFKLPGKKGQQLFFDPEVYLLADLNVENNPFDMNGKKFKQVASDNCNRGIYEPKLIGYNQKHLLQPGDLLFQDLDCGPLCDAIESVTQGYQGSNFSHVAMVSEIENDTVWIFEAIGGKVKQTALKDFLGRSFDVSGQPKVMVGRITNEEISSKAISHVKQFYGKAYDDIFDINNDRYYCSELIYYSYMDGNDPIFNLLPMTFKAPGTDEFDPAWIEYYRELGVSIPEGEPGLNPGGISRSHYVNMIYRFGNPKGYNTQLK